MLNQERAGFLFQVSFQVDANEHARLHGIERNQREKTNSSLNQASSDADGGMDLTDERHTAVDSKNSILHYPGSYTFLFKDFFCTQCTVLIISMFSNRLFIQSFIIRIFIFWRLNRLHRENYFDHWDSRWSILWLVKTCWNPLFLYNYILRNNVRSPASLRITTSIRITISMRSKSTNGWLCTTVYPTREPTASR